MDVKTIHRYASFACLIALLSAAAFAQDAASSTTRIDHLRRQARSLAEQGAYEQARVVQEQAERLQQSEQHWQANRIQHLQRAAESLREGGFLEESGQLQERARQMERALHPNSGDARLDAALTELRAIRRSLDQLREEVAALRRAAELNQTPEPTIASPREENLNSPRRRRISDEELDAPVESSSGSLRFVPEPTPAAPKPRPGGELDFELVPVRPGEDHKPVPAPIPTADAKTP